MKTFSTERVISRLAICIISIVVLTFLLLPVVYAIVWSFTGKHGFISLTKNFSFKWYINVFTDRSWLNAISESLLYALVSSSISLLLTIIYYYYSLWYRNFYQLIGYILIILPLFFPLIVYALALKVFSVNLSIPEFASTILGHIVIIIPFQFFILEGSNENIKMDWLHSSIVMGAKHIEIIRKLVIPNIYITLVIAFICGYLYSFDEIIISNFIIDSADITVPKKIWLEINRDITPSPGVVYTTLLIITLFTLGIVYYYLKVNSNTKMTKKTRNKIFLFQDLKSTLKSGLIVVCIDMFFEFIAYGHIEIWKVIVSFFFGVLIYEIGLHYIVTIFSWGKEIIDKIYLYRKEEHTKYKDLAIGLLSYKIDQSISELHNFFHNNDGVAVSIHESEKLSELLFENNKGYYFGTDSNVPSKFKELYPSYLLSSQQSKSSARILLCSEQELTKDFKNKKNDFVNFCEWHTRNNVTLLMVNKSISTNLVSKLNLSNSDIGIWDDDYVVIFRPQGQKIHYWFKSYHTIDETKRYIKFYLSLLNEAKLVRYSNGRLSFENFPKHRNNDIVQKVKNLWKI